MLELVNQLLELSKLESGKTKLIIGEYDFKQFCAALCGLFESLAIQKEIDFKLTMPDEPVHAYFDKDVMEKILVNLISNAFKFTPAGGEIEFSLEKNGKSDFLISVRDTGIGIDPTHVDQLFNRFLSFSDSDVQQSSGIGLSLVRELVTLHKADIQVKSTGIPFPFKGFKISCSAYVCFELCFIKQITYAECQAELFIKEIFFNCCIKH